MYSEGDGDRGFKPVWNVCCCRFGLTSIFQMLIPPPCFSDQMQKASTAPILARRFQTWALSGRKAKANVGRAGTSSVVRGLEPIAVGVPSR